MIAPGSAGHALPMAQLGSGPLTPWQAVAKILKSGAVAAGHSRQRGAVWGSPLSAEAGTAMGWAIPNGLDAVAQFVAHRGPIPWTANVGSSAPVR